MNIKLFLKYRLAALVGLLVFVIGYGAGSAVTTHTKRITSDAYVACMADPDVQFVSKMEMFNKALGVPLDKLEEAIKEANQGENLKKAQKAFEVYKKHSKSPNGASIEAFTDCLNK